MVRVVSCHHFVSQDVFLSENEPVAFCGAQDKLLISTTQHAVNVHDLEARGNVLHSFPTVDIVKQILYCESGNYVATIESKASRHNSDVSYVRVYFKWWIDVNSQPLRVRVAGSASLPDDDHLLNKKQFEMVELPLEKTAIFIASCNRTSALAVSLGNIISLFCYSTKIHPPSKRLYHDFDHFVDISVPIFVKQVNICENYFACMSNKAVVVFKVCENEVETSAANLLDKQDEKDSELFDESFVEWRFESCTYGGTKDKVWENHIEKKLHPDSFPINIHLHAIDKANENFCEDHECEFYGPLLTVKGCTIDIRLNSRTFEMFPAISSNIYSVILLFKQFNFKENDMQLKSLQLMPFHELESSKGGFNDPLNAAASESEKCNHSLPWPNITSSTTSLKAMGVFFSTCLEGFLYNVTEETQFVDSYAYTSTMKGVFLESSLLHALTETGLETYTVHLPHSILEQVEKADNVTNIVPKYDSEVCLLGLRPFLGVDYLVKSDNHLILVSSLEDSVSNSDTEGGGNRSTLYSLKEPSPVQVFMDLLEVAECQKVNSPNTYHDLLSEAHMILRTQCFLGASNQNKEIQVLFKKSCLLLADYYICSDASSKLNAIPYYHLSQLPAEHVLKRILDFRLQPKYGNILRPLIIYVNSIMFSGSGNASLTLPQAIADPIVSAYADESPEMLWKIVLCSDFTGYKLDKAILLLKRRLTNKKHPLSPISNAADTVALVYLLLPKGTTEAAENVLLSVAKTDLCSIITNIPDKIWTGMSLTFFGKFVKQMRPDAFVDLLISYVDQKKFSLSDVIQFLQSESPNTDLHCVPLLREFLEEILKDKALKNDSAAMALLVKIYLKQLLGSKESTDTHTSSSPAIICTFSHFFTSRASWLNEMPPFNGKISRTCVLLSHFDPRKKTENKPCSCWNCNENLLRLQSLLSYVGPLEEIKGMVLEFLYSAGNKDPNWLSLEVMCSSEAQAIKLLIGMVPRALLPFAKEIFKADKKKWSLLFLLLNEHIITLSEDHPNSETYSKTFQAVLSHLAETLSIEEILRLLPQERNALFLPNVKRCVERHQADLLRNKIVSLGQEIKLMMHS